MSGRHSGDEEAELVLLALAGEQARECMYCGVLMVVGDSGDTWGHDACEAAYSAWADRWEVRRDPRESSRRTERRLRDEGRCTHQAAYAGWDGPDTYCGQPVTDSGSDRPCPEDDYCLMHQAESQGDDEGAAQERAELVAWLLRQQAGGA
jgi:hypothetical protein